jgi:hypothetical protein
MEFCCNGIFRLLECWQKCIERIGYFVENWIHGHLTAAYCLYFVQDKLCFWKVFVARPYTISDCSMVILHLISFSSSQSTWIGTKKVGGLVVEVWVPAHLIYQTWLPLDLYLRGNMREFVFQEKSYTVCGWCGSDMGQGWRHISHERAINHNPHNQTEIPTLLDHWVTNRHSVKMSCPQ